MTEELELSERVRNLENQVEALSRAVFTPAALSQPNMSDAVRETQHQLGAEQVNPTARQPKPPRQELEGQMSVEDALTSEPDERAIASAKAATRASAPLTRNFRPSLVGYTATMFKQDYPDLNPGELVEQFFNFHLSRGTTSKNWLEEFFKFAGRAQQWANEGKVGGWGETDSMGLPTDPVKRREMLGHTREEGQDATHSNQPE